MYGSAYTSKSILEHYDTEPTTGSKNLVDSGAIKQYVDSSDALIDAKVDNMISRVANPFVFKGTVAAFSNLPSSGNTVNDTYFVEAEGFMYTWNGTSWDKTSTDVNNQLAHDIATEYDPLKSDYKSGEIVMYNNQVYVRNTDATSAEGTFVSANWTATSIGDELVNEITDLKSAINTEIANRQSADVKKVNQPLNQNNQPVNGTNGQSLRTKGDGTTEWADIGLPTDAQTETAISAWMTAHPEATTTVQDGSLTEAKFSNALKLTAIKDYVTPEMFGAVGDGTVDDYQAIVNAFSASVNTGKTLYFQNKTYYSSMEIVIESVPNLIMDGKIKFGSLNGLTLGTNSGQLDRKTIIINIITTTTSSDAIGLKIINASNCNITIDYVDGFYRGVLLIGDSGAFAYNTITINYIRSVNKSLIIDKANSGYNNENVYVGGRFVETTKAESVAITVTGNNHVFIKPCAEYANVCFKFIKGKQNMVISCRSENSDKVANFDSDSYNNSIEVGYGSTLWDGNSFNKISHYGLTSDSIVANTFNLSVYDSGNLKDKISIVDTTATFTSPLKYLATNRSIPLDSINSAYFSITGNVVQIINGCLGVYVDCSIAKEFLVLQGTLGAGRVLVKLYDDTDNLLDMSDMDIGLGSTYTSNYGGAILASTYTASVIILPNEAKKAFIGVAKTSSGDAKFIGWSIKSKNIATVLES